jgi:hypothetical protein
VCNAELSREPATSDLVPPISWVERTCNSSGLKETRNSSGHSKRMLLLGKIFWPQAGFEPGASETSPIPPNHGTLVVTAPNSTLVVTPFQCVCGTSFEG